MPRGEHIEFIIETEKLEKIEKVVKHNDGKIVEHENLPGALKLKVRKI